MLLWSRRRRRIVEFFSGSYSDSWLCWIIIKMFFAVLKWEMRVEWEFEWIDNTFYLFFQGIKRGGRCNREEKKKRNEKLSWVELMMTMMAIIIRNSEFIFAKLGGESLQVCVFTSLEFHSEWHWESSRRGWRLNIVLSCRFFIFPLKAFLSFFLIDFNESELHWCHY